MRIEQFSRKVSRKRMQLEKVRRKKGLGQTEAKNDATIDNVAAR